MRPEYALLFLALIALTYARSNEDVREEIKNEIEKDILEDLAEDEGELDDKDIDVDDAKPFRVRFRRVRKIRLRRLVPYIPTFVRLAGTYGKK
uniref:Arminin 407 n=1 Tax=Hydra viridissima TaxID=6082 RepID=R9UFK9_HYDVD|nr:arminin 407 [Hydra viridissima]